MTDNPEVTTIRVGDDQGRGGLYNMIMPGGFERAAALLPAIGLNPEAGHLFRLRDAWVEKDAGGPVIHVYTRVGGGNREDYAEVIELLRNNEHYLRDADDSYDGTYASFWFRLPLRFAQAVADIAVEPIDTGERWKKMLDALGGKATSQ